MKKGKKLNGEILSVRDCEGGVSGILGETRKLTNRNGETLRGNYDQELEVFELADFKTGEVKTYWFDGGLRGAFSLAKITPGAKIFIEHTGDKKLETGFVQTYDVYGAE